MRSNFKSPLKIDNGAVRTRGELDWGPGEEQALVSVSISQKGRGVAGMATSPNPFDEPTPEWKLDIKPGYYGTSFKAGPADAVGIVCAMSDDKVRVFFWSQEVQLET
jgi:hypothetical protein